MASFRVERKILRERAGKIAGVDEAGRGALFGPVMAAAVVFPAELIERPVRGWLKEVKDSKCLSPRQRERLAVRILTEAESVGVGAASAREIDRENIYWASIEAMKRAVANLTVRPDFLLIDGPWPAKAQFPCPQLCLRGGDRTSISISAASIIAKVVRDELIGILEEYFQGYQLVKNKGYGTAEHYRALRERGPSPLHRLSFNLGGG